MAGERSIISKLLRPSVVLAVVALVIVGVVSFVVDALNEIAAGHGVDLYITGSGAKASYISALVLLAILPLVVGVAWVWSRWSRY